MRQGRGRSAAGRRVRMRGRRRHAACTAGARSSGPARAAARRCSSCRRCRRRATRRRTRWSRRRRRCDGRGRPLSPPRPRPRGPPRSGLDPPRAPRRPEPASRRSRQRAGPRRCEARASGSRGDARRERTAPRPARFREVCAGARPAPASRAPLPARPGSDLSWRLRVAAPVVTPTQGQQGPWGREARPHSHQHCRRLAHGDAGRSRPRPASRGPRAAHPRGSDAGTPGRGRGHGHPHAGSLTPPVTLRTAHARRNAFVRPFFRRRGAQHVSRARLDLCARPPLSASCCRARTPGLWPALLARHWQVAQAGLEAVLAA